MAAQSHDGDVAIVVHPDTPVNNLTLAEVRKVFLGERQDGVQMSRWSCCPCTSGARAECGAEDYLSDVDAVQTVLDR
jgi:hypothetical protein